MADVNKHYSIQSPDWQRAFRGNVHHPPRTVTFATFAMPNSGEAPTPYFIPANTDLVKFSNRNDVQFQVSTESGTDFDTNGYATVPGTARWATEPGELSGTGIYFRSATGASGTNSVAEVERWAY